MTLAQLLLSERIFAVEAPVQHIYHAFVDSIFATANSIWEAARTFMGNVRQYLEEL